MSETFEKFLLKTFLKLCIPEVLQTPASILSTTNPAILLRAKLDCSASNEMVGYMMIRTIINLLHELSSAIILW